ncbi:MAG: adenylate kinase family protein [Candidatus Aenigmarchaeota archaeon]|nr:adenylate kinase family protein [Candidatus Aenigmarchaeota archaeon]
MIIAIAGTPGTGKTQVAKALSIITGFKIISTKSAALHGAVSGRDAMRKAMIVDPTKLQKAVNKMIKGDSIIEGMLSHLLKADIIVVLRCNPTEIQKRLKSRKWSARKIRENVQAEILDTITIEALGKRRKVVEIDTSKKSGKEAALIIKNMISGKIGKKYNPGSINWTKKYGNYLLDAEFKRFNI